MGYTDEITSKDRPGENVPSSYRIELVDTFSSGFRESGTHMVRMGKKFNS